MKTLLTLLFFIHVTVGVDVCTRVNCAASDINSHCEEGACVCNTGFTMNSGICTKDAAGGLKPASEYRTLDGIGNNPENPSFGASGTRLQRFVKAHYDDEISTPRGSDGKLPNPREISNRVFFHEGEHTASVLGLSDFLTYWGQFMDHDMGHAEMNYTANERIDILMPLGDEHFDPDSFGNRTIPLIRSNFDPSSGTSKENPREQINSVTSFFDCSQVYGETIERAAALREFKGGRMITTENGKMPPKNILGFPMENHAKVLPDEELYFVGDARGNENPALLSLQVLFLREHNRWAKIFEETTDWDDETLYQEARRRVIAIYQNIIINEYIPVVLGEPLPPYTGFKAGINPGIFNEFSHAAFRYGHSEVNSAFPRLNEEFKATPGGPIKIKEAFFNPALLDEGVEPIFRGLSRSRQREVDTMVIEELRNFLFGQPGKGGLDLVSINIQRGRDHGLAPFNEVRKALGLAPYANFQEMTDFNTANALEEVYEDIENCDLWVCGIAETHAISRDAGSTRVVVANLGETFKTIIKKQYTYLRDGDRFWFQNLQFSDEEFNVIRRTTLANVIVRNTDIEELQCFVMGLPDGCITTPTDTPQPTSEAIEPENQNEFVVEVSAKSDLHPYATVGFPFGYLLNGQEAPELTLTRGTTYFFRVEASCSHRFYISSSEAGNGVGTVFDGVRNSGACSGEVLEFTPTDSHPSKGLFYQCQYHDFMGGPIVIVSSASSLLPVLALLFVALLVLM